MPTKTDIQKKAILEALQKSLGIVTTACLQVEIARSTFYDWCEKDKNFKSEVDELENIALDWAESQLHKRMKDGSDAAIIFFLKTKGKSRGYIERSQLDLNNNVIHVKAINKD